MDNSSATTPPGEGDQTIDKRDTGQLECDSDVTAAPSLSLEDTHHGEPLSASWRNEPLTSDEASKVARILYACEEQDVKQLIELAATRGGFVEDHVRRLACTKLPYLQEVILN